MTPAWIALCMFVAWMLFIFVLCAAEWVATQLELMERKK